MTETPDDDLEFSLRDMVTELQKARDEVRVQLHLGGMEAKDKFSGLEAKLHKLEARAHAIGDDPADELKEGLGHLRSAFRALRDNLKQS